MNLRADGWTERMVVATLADFTTDPASTSPHRTERLFMGYWLQRHGLSEADVAEVVEACRRLEAEGVVRRPNGGEPDDPDTTWELTDDGVTEATELRRVFAKAL